MTKRIIFKTETGGVAVIIPSPEWTGTLEELAEKNITPNTPWKIVDASEIPSDNTFRDAWKWQVDMIVVDINAAKEIKRNQFRQARKPMLEQLDVEYMRAVETSNAAKKKAIVDKKQQLRDITIIELPDDVDELAKFLPDVLKSA